MKTQKKGDLHERIQKLAKQLPPEEITIKKRLTLLDLSPKAQMFLDKKELSIAEAEALVSLKEIVDIRMDTLSEGLSEDFVLITEDKKCQ